MKIILLKDVAKLGRKFDVKDVSSGHALNLLIPQGLAIVATPDAMKRTEVERSQIEAERKIHEDLLVKNIKDLDGITLTIASKANEKGHLFAGIHKDAIVIELQKQTELQIDPSFIQMDQPLKITGEHTIEVKGGGKTAKFKVVIESR
jgi:large subunit ribosomal protein L9